LGDLAHLHLVYIAEAHSVDGWQTDSNEAAGIRINQHTEFGERWEAALLCAERLSLSIPTLVDGMDNAACVAFSAWPERMYIIHEGRIHYRGGQGPYDFDVPEARESLMALLAETG
jgi:hypothetical protein